MLLVEQNGCFWRGMPGINQGKEASSYHNASTGGKNKRVRLEGRIASVVDIGHNILNPMDNKGWPGLSDEPGLKPDEPGFKGLADKKMGAEKKHA